MVIARLPWQATYKRTTKYMRDHRQLKRVLRRHPRYLHRYNQLIPNPSKLRAHYCLLSKQGDNKHLSAKPSTPHDTMARLETTPGPSSGSATWIDMERAGTNSGAPSLSLRHACGLAPALLFIYRKTRVPGSTQLTHPITNQSHHPAR
jgi:hypothetical protein